MSDSEQQPRRSRSKKSRRGKEKDSSRRREKSGSRDKEKREHKDKRERRSRRRDRSSSEKRPRRLQSVTSNDDGTGARIQKLVLPSPKRAEQPKPMLTPSMRPSLTPRLGDSKRFGTLEASPKGSIAGEPGYSVPPELIQTMHVVETEAVRIDLPPLPEQAGYVGQYVQSALTGDFIAANPALFNDNQAGDTGKARYRSNMYPADFRRAMQILQLVFSQLQVGMIFLFILVVYAETFEYGQFIWFYSNISNSLQKVTNAVAFSAFSLSLCILAVANACMAEEEPEHTEEHDGGEAGNFFCSHFRRAIDNCAGHCCTRWGLRQVQTTGGGLHDRGGRSKTMCVLPFLWIKICLLALIYAGIAVCCVITAAYDDVLWGYREWVEREYEPRSPMVSRQTLKVRDRIYEPFGADKTPGSDCHWVGNEKNTDDKDPVQCVMSGCCYRGEDKTCTVPDPSPVKVILNTDSEMDDPPFNWDMGAEACHRIDRMLCSIGEMCPDGDISKGVQHLITPQPDVERLSPAFDQRWLMVNMENNCEPVDGSPRYFKGNFQVFCCSACAEKYSKLEADASLASRTDTFNRASTARVFLSIVGYLIGLTMSASAFANPDSTERPTEDTSEMNGTERELHPRAHGGHHQEMRPSLPKTMSFV